MKVKMKPPAMLAAGWLALGWAGAGPAQELRLEELIAEALSNNLELKARAEEETAAGEQVGPAGALPDPMVSVGVMSLPVDSWSFSAEPMTQTQVGLSQAFPFPGKRSLLTRAARAERDASEARVDAARLRVIREVRESYAELYYLDHALELTRQNQEVLRQLGRVAGAKYAVGQGVQADVLKAQVELSLLLDQEIALNQARQAAAANLNRLLGRDPAEAVGPARRMELAPLRAEVAALAEKALSANPELMEANQMVAASESLARLSARSYYPDFTLMVAWGFRGDLVQAGRRIDQPDLFSAGVGFNLPVYSYRKQSRERAASQARLRSREHERAEQVLRLKEEVIATYAEAGRAWQELMLYRSGIIPQSRQSLESALTAYQVNRVDFLTLLDNQQTLLDQEIRLRRLEADYSRACARLDELSARPPAELLSDRNEARP